MKARFNNIKRNSLYEEIFEILKEAILSGGYESGEALPSEVELSHQLGVSRTVVREAIRSLQSRGFLEIRRGARGGVYILDLNQSTICENLADLIMARKITMNHLAQARMYLEPEVSRLAAIHATRKDLESMENAIEEYERTQDKEKIITLNTRFHLCVGKACGNPFYSILMEVIMGFTEQFVRTIKPITHIIHRQGEHREILEAIKQHNPNEAMEITIHHISYINNEMRKLEEKYLQLKTGLSNTGSF
jgi:GntR family transcriptional repressor for pyruvate dehydrogenase complex